jgi:hypothetical protein
MAGTSPTGDSRTVTEEELRKLRFQENTLVDEILKHDGTLKDKIVTLAQTMEKRFELLDPMIPPDFTINQISSTISRLLRSLNCPIAPWVSEYLPDKYKNPNIHKQTKMITDLKSIIEDPSVAPRESIEQCSNSQLEIMLEYIQKLEHLKDDLGTSFTNWKWDVRSEGMKRGIDLGGEKYRDQISARDYRWEIPDDAELDELHEETIKQCERVIHEYDIFIHVNYPQYRTPLKDKERQYGNAFRVYANMLQIVNEKKWSGELDFWLDRNYWRKAQSSHMSGNSTYFPTTLCARCSVNVQEDPKDFHISKYDPSSPSGYRCDNCGSTEIRKRNNTREQTGDKGPEVDRMASDVINHIPHYVDIFKDYRNSVLNPAIYARKDAIAIEFEKASMGKDKIVIPRKESKQR